jgi:hypothetical protein
MCHPVTCSTKVNGDMRMNDSPEKTKRQQAAESGRKFLLQEGFKSVTGGVCEQVGWILKARNSFPVDDDHYFGATLHDEISDLINCPEWHTKRVLRIALEALVSEQAWSLRKHYLANSTKTFFGFPVKNPFSESYLAWEHIERLDGFGQTGLGALESLRAISNQKIHVPTLMFDLCHKLIAIDALNITSKSSSESLYFENRLNPNETSSYKFIGLDSDSPCLNKEGKNIDLRKIFGFTVSLDCIPERLQWHHESDKNPHHSIHLTLSRLKIGSDNSYSFLGHNQFFATDGEKLIVLPDVKNLRLTNLKQRAIDKSIIQVARRVEEKNQPDFEDGKSSVGHIDLYYQNKTDFYDAKYPDEIFLEVGLNDSDFEKLVNDIKFRNIKNIYFSAVFSIESVFTTSGSYDGWSKDIIFHNFNQAFGEINSFSIEYHVK